jgi:hypothetical protein
MTIALGLLAKDGLVLAADTEETYGASLKHKHTKIWAALATDQSGDEAKFRCCVVSGAGDGSYIDAISRQIVESVTKREELPDAEIESGFRATLRDFYAEHVLPFAADRNPPEFELLIGVQLPQARLLRTGRNVLYEPFGDFIACGSGLTMAYPLLSRFYQGPRPDVRTAVLVAAYVMYHTKEAVPGCGKATEIMGFAEDRTFEVRSDIMDELERAIADYSRHTEPAMLRAALGDEVPAAMVAVEDPRARLAAVAAGFDLGLRMPRERRVG